MKVSLLCFGFLLSINAFAETQLPQFPQNFPKAYGKLGKFQPALQKIGANYCKQAAQAPSVLPRIANPQYQAMLSAEIKVAAVICKGGVYRGFPQTPKDENLKLLTDFEILRLTTFKLFILYKEAPPSQVMIQLVMRNLNDFDTLLSREITAAYNAPCSEEFYPPTSEIAKWVRQIHALYGSEQIQ
jgi:hypothetical protein